MKCIKLILLLTSLTIMSIGYTFGQNGPGAFPKALSENNFFSADISKFPPEKRKNLKDEGAKPNDGKNDTPVLQKLINNLSDNGGGVITIPAGKWDLIFVNMKSNVHLVINSGAVIRPVKSSGKTILFRIGWDSYVSRNVSIRSNDGKKFKVDISSIGVLRKFSVVAVKGSENFRISDMYVQDNWTAVSAIDFAGSRFNGSWSVPRKGLIKNIHVEKAQGDYGLAQVRSAKQLLFKNISSTGGITLLIETDNFNVEGGKMPQNLARVEKISAFDVRCTNGNAAVMLQPWGASNGWIDVQKIVAKSCMAAVRIDRPHQAGSSKGKGKFSPTSRISDVQCTYGTQAMVKKGIDFWVPCTVRNNNKIYKPQPIWKQPITFRRGPTVAPILYRASDTKNPSSSLNYKVRIPSYKELRQKAKNFPDSFIMILRQNHRVNCDNCGNKGKGCDDGDPCTSNDKITPNCYCAGNYTCKN